MENWLVSSDVIFPSFASGELSPSLLARVDLSKYHTGCRTLRNFFVDYRSGASTRPGTKFCNVAFKSATAIRLIPFQSSLLVPYILEFGDAYCRVFSNGVPITETGLAISAISQANPCVVSVPGNPYVVGDWIFLSNIGGMTPLNGLFFKVLNVAGANITIGNVITSAPINSLGYPAFTSGGTAARVYTFASPYAAADLALVKYVQVANQMYLTHPSYPPQILTLTNPTSWAFAPITFGTTVGTPTGLSTSATTGTGAYFAYAVTAVDVNGQESLAGTVAANNVVNVTTTSGTITVSWSAVAGAVAYNVYRAELSVAGAVPSGAAFGFQGNTTGTSFIDSNIVPDFSQTPPAGNSNPFSGAGNNPGTCCFFQQRLYFGGTNNFPQTFWASQPGLYNNMNFSDPIQADDAYNDTLVSRQVNAIKSMLPMPGGLIMFTAQGAWQLSSGQGVAATSAVTPINATASPQSYNGATDLPPIPINWDVLYTQPDGAVIDLNYNIYAAIYTGNDISVLSNHLFFGFALNEWAYQQKPYKIVWAVRNDGQMLSLTYVKEQEMFGWARHDTFGLFKSVATVTEGQYDAIYVAVQRRLQGQLVQCIERFDNRIDFKYGPEDAWQVDCGIRTVLPTPAANLQADSSTGTVNFTADAPVFSAPNVGSVLRMDGGIATITQFLSSQVVQGTWSQDPTQIVANDPNDTPIPAASGSWSLTIPSTTFTGLDYLNGQTVQILADGNVQAPQTVIAGAITLPQPATKVVAGLGFQRQLQTMPLDLGNTKDTVAGKRKRLNGVTVRAMNTRGVKFGRTFATVIPFKEMSQAVPMGQPIPLLTGDYYAPIDPLWDVPGQVCIQIDDPVPASILGIIPEVTIGDTPGKQ